MSKRLKKNEGQKKIEQNRRSVAIIDSWLAESEEPTDEDRAQFEEFLRDIDAHRGERKLFED